MLLMIVMLKKLLERFIKNNCRNKSKTIYDRKSNKKKDDKLYVKWKDYENSFNIWIDRKNIV